MGKINVARVLLGGLVAGLVLNVGEYLLNEVVLRDQWAAATASMNLPAFGAAQIAGFVILTFLYGIVLVWLYAAIRPRFGAGVKTAILAGVALWAIGWLLFSASLMIMGMFPAGLMLAGMVWGLIEVPLASVAGAWLYQES